MAYTGVQDQLGLIARELFRQQRALGWHSRIGLNWDGQAVGRLAKACGATPGQVESWLAGETEPPVGQGLRLLDALPFPELQIQPVPVMANGHGHG